MFEVSIFVVTGDQETSQIGEGEGVETG